MDFSKSQYHEKKKSRGILLNTERLETYNDQMQWPNAMLESWLYTGYKEKKKNPENSYKRHFSGSWEHLNIDCILNDVIE